MSNETTQPKRLSLNERLLACVAHVGPFFAGLKDGLLNRQALPAATPNEPLPTSDQRTEALAQIEQAARNGFVPDAYVESLLASYVDELADTRRQLGEAEAVYQANVRRLEAMFPEPPAPLPEPPAPPTPRIYPRVKDLLGGNGKANPLH